MDRSFLSYQFVGTTNNLHEGRSPSHIRKISNRLGFEVKERNIVEEFLPTLKELSAQKYDGTRSMAVSPKVANRQQELTRLKKRVIKLQALQENLIRQIQTQIFVPDDLFFTNKDNTTEFESYFRKLPIKFQQEKEKLKLVQYTLAQVKNKVFMLENYVDQGPQHKAKYFSSSVNSENQKIQLSDLSTDLPRIARTARKRGNTKIVAKPLKLSYNTENQKESCFVRQIQMPQFVKEKHLDIILPLNNMQLDVQFSDHQIRNPNDKSIQQVKDDSQDEELAYVNLMIDSDDDDRPNTKPSRQQTARISKPMSTQYQNLQSSKQALVTHRFFKYNDLYTQCIKFRACIQENEVGKLQKCLHAVLFAVRLIAQTKSSLQVYNKIASSHHKQYFPTCNEDCLQFVNLTLVKQIFCKPQRVAQLQKLSHSNTQQRLIQISACIECVAEIYNKLISGNFTQKLYRFLKTISSTGYYSLNNFHSQNIMDRLRFSSLFGYLNGDSDQQKKLIIFEFVVIKNIIFYGMFFKVEELFRQLKVEAEVLYTVVGLMIYLFAPDLNPIGFVNKKFDGQYSLDHVRILDSIYQNMCQEFRRLELTSLRSLQDQWLEKVIKHIE